MLPFALPLLLLNANTPAVAPLFQLPPRMNHGLPELAKFALYDLIPTCPICKVAKQSKIFLRAFFKVHDLPCPNKKGGQGKRFTVLFIFVLNYTWRSQGEAPSELSKNGAERDAATRIAVVVVECKHARCSTVVPTAATDEPWTA